MPMTPEKQIAIVVTAVISLFALVMFLRTYLARQRRIREGRDVDIGKLILFGSAAGEGEKTKLKTDRN